MYTVVNSRAYAGELGTGMETGRKAMIAIDVVVGAVLVCAEILLMRNCRKKNVQEKISPGEMRSPQPCDRLNQGLTVPEIRHCQALIFDVYFLERGRRQRRQGPFPSNRWYARNSGQRQQAPTGICTPYTAVYNLCQSGGFALENPPKTWYPSYKSTMNTCQICCAHWALPCAAFAGGVILAKIKSWQILTAGAAALFAAEWSLSNIVVNPVQQLNTREKCEDELKLAGLTMRDWEQNWHRRDIAIKSRYGYTLRGAVIPHDSDCAPADGRTRVVVIVHGYTVNQIASLKYAALFRRLGFACIVYDHRNHGLSDHALTTMGRREAEDLATVCDWARDHFGRDCILGTHGESMGAATVMLHSALDRRLAFVIEDCGYSSLKKQLAYVMRTRYRLPPELLLYPSMGVAWLRTGVRFSQVEPARAVARSGNTPMLFIHGDADTYVPFSMLQENYDAKCTGPRRKAVFPGAAHAMSLLSDPERYQRVVATFLRDNHIL